MTIQTVLKNVRRFLFEDLEMVLMACAAIVGVGLIAEAPRTGVGPGAPTEAITAAWIGFWLQMAIGVILVFTAGAYCVRRIYRSHQAQRRVRRALSRYRARHV